MFQKSLLQYFFDRTAHKFRSQELEHFYEKSTQLDLSATTAESRILKNLNHHWVLGLLAKGVYVVSSDICDYEVRRSLLLLETQQFSKVTLDRLDRWQEVRRNYRHHFSIATTIKAAKVFAQLDTMERLVRWERDRIPEPV